MKRAVVTGGASPDGIGWATALALVDDGYEVIVTGVSSAELQTTPAHSSIKAVVLDVRSEADVNALFAGLDRLDALVNCAGAADPASEFTPGGFARTLDIN